MYLSHYLKCWQYGEAPGYQLLYSTQKGSLVLIPNEELSLLKEDKGTADYTDPLYGLGMLVPDQEKEKAEVFNFLSEINRLNPGINISVILGLECNFSCPYCYEGSLKGKLTMNDETVDQLVAFVKDQIRPGKEKITLDFYGGEPLLYTKQIKRIAGALKPYAKKRGLKFKFTLVTNGSLLSRLLVEELLFYGLYAAKITVDGPAVTHNLMRPFKEGQPSFDLILKNIKECLGLIKIGISGNFSRDNFIEFPRMFDDLAALDLTPDLIGNVRFSPVNQTCDEFANPEFTGGCTSCDEPWIAEAAILLREETMKRGYKTPKMNPSPCMVDVQDAYTVHFNGDLFKCIAMIGHKKYATGDIWKGVRSYQTTYNVDHWKSNAKCRDCVYLPLCFGGCRNIRFQREGDMAEVECQKEFLDRILETTIKQDVKYLHRVSQ